MNRYFRKSNKKSAILALLAILAISAAAGSLIAYAVSRNTSVIQNDMEFAESVMQLIEDSDPGFGKKEITFKNNASVENGATQLLRIAYSETWTSTDGTVISNTVNGINVVAKSWTTAFVNDFVDGNDGWYYYEKTLAPGEEVKVLNSISLNNPDYNIYNYDISFRFESIQTTAGAATALWNKTPTISNNGEVTWAP